MDFAISFIELLLAFLALLSPILLLLSVLIVAAAFVAKRYEKWSLLNTLYWAAITATTVGYGDMRPLHRPSRIMAVLIAVLGIMFTGVIVSATVSAATHALEIHTDQGTIERIKTRLKEKQMREALER
ncbi:potassium channel family protein [Agaribacterium haliotis]|uniref:potassium channel family protein n=1 Tax=Agaribacterium haliotis TaxID=2013869 RepID=UPI000BB552AB|nr:potassium channel family protein [Agaribacterium haliotis]